MLRDSLECNVLVQHATLAPERFRVYIQTALEMALWRKINVCVQEQQEQMGMGVEACGLQRGALLLHWPTVSGVAQHRNSWPMDVDGGWN